MAAITGFFALSALASGSWVMLLICGGIAAACGLTAKANFEFNRDRFPRLYHSWEHTYQCDRCATRFVWGMPPQAQSAPQGQVAFG